MPGKKQKTTRKQTATKKASTHKPGRPAKDRTLALPHWSTYLDEKDSARLTKITTAINKHLDAVKKLRPEFVKLRNRGNIRKVNAKKRLLRERK